MKAPLFNIYLCGGMALFAALLQSPVPTLVECWLIAVSVLILE